MGPPKRVRLPMPGSRGAGFLWMCGNRREPCPDLLDVVEYRSRCHVTECPTRRGEMQALSASRSKINTRLAGLTVARLYASRPPRLPITKRGAEPAQEPV